jgi:20S proteasome alpha/beta subunit
MWSWLLLGEVILLLLIAFGQAANPLQSLDQISRAIKAASRGGLVFAAAGLDGVVVWLEDSLTEDGLPGSTKNVAKISDRMCMVASGLSADVHWLEQVAVSKALECETGTIQAVRLANEIADRLFDLTLEKHSRPLGAAAIISTINDQGSSLLYEIHPTGLVRACRAACIGRDAEKIKKLWSLHLTSTDECRPQAMSYNMNMDILSEKMLRCLHRALCSNDDDDDAEHSSSAPPPVDPPNFTEVIRRNKLRVFHLRSSSSNTVQVTEQQ